MKAITLNIFFAGCLLSSVLLASHKNSSDISFNQLMMVPRNPLSEDDTELMHQLEMEYTRNIRFLSQTPLKHIPKVLHFIWLGPRPFPDKSILNLKSWQDLHPKWKMNFWTDSKERPLPIAGMKLRLLQEGFLGPFRKLFSSTQNWAEKSDLLRYMILFREGGVYIDHDVEAKRSISSLVTHYDFVIGLEAFGNHPTTNSSVNVCNALIMSRPGHPIVRNAIKIVRQRWNEMANRFPNNNLSDNVQRVIASTYDSMVIAVKKKRNLYRNKDIVLPNSYFYSYPVFDEITTEKLQKDGYVYAVHQFAASWWQS
jgi:mannosyltransferase OCH1-like enzyme